MTTHALSVYDPDLRAQVERLADAIDLDAFTGLDELALLSGEMTRFYALVLWQRLLQRVAARAHWPGRCPAEQHPQEDDMATHNDAVTEQREAEAREHVQRARAIIGAKAKEGNFDISSTTVGSLILALEALLGEEKKEGQE